MWIKVCGVTGADAVAAALAAEVDAIGFVFAASVRRVQPAEAAALAAPARGRCALVAVTLHPSQLLIDEILRVLHPDVLQTDASDLAALRLPDALVRLPVLRAVSAVAPAIARSTAVEPSDGPVATDSLHSAVLPTRLLFESGSSGSGTRADWSQAAGLARRRELILAGGLSPHNVAEAIDYVRPFGVDVSSGVESAPGRKDPTLIGEFVQAARVAALSRGI